MALERADVAPVVTTSPTDTISIDVPGSAELNGPPRKTFETRVRDFAIDVLSEASHRELSTRGDSSNEVQYTSAIFEQAIITVRNAGYAPKVPKWHPWARVLAPLGLTLGGVAIPLPFIDGIWPGWGIVGAVLVSVSAMGSLFLELTKKSVL